MRGRRRVYADTSVFGGCHDIEFEQPSRAFFEEVRQGRFVLVVSSLVEAELETAPAVVQATLATVLPWVLPAGEPERAVNLSDAYLRAQVVTEQWRADALHVATAVVAACDVLVSWNFRHIVHLDKIRLYNQVNADEGYGPIAIHSPPEVLGYDQEL